MPARREAPFLARSVATCTCLTNENMSGARRVLSSTDGSIFLAAAKASALSRIADRALRPTSRAGSDARDIENDMRVTPDLLNGTAAPAEMEAPRARFKYAASSPTVTTFAPAD